MGSQGFNDSANAAKQKTIAAFQAARSRMVLEQLKQRGIRDPGVLAAMAAVPRHRFIPPELWNAAYQDSPLPIGFGQTISQPYIVAYMVNLADIHPGDRVLEIGTGCGYAAAVLGQLAREVWSVEIVPELAQKSRSLLQDLGYGNIHVQVGNGYEGWPEQAPYQAIVVSAAPPFVPPPLIEQLDRGGRLVLPVGTKRQRILTVDRSPEGTVEQRKIPVQFVPMVKTRHPKNPYS